MLKVVIDSAFILFLDNFACDRLPSFRQFTISNRLSTIISEIFAV